MISSLRARLSVWYLAILTLSLCLFSLLMYAFLSTDLQQHHDDRLSEDAAKVRDVLATVPMNQAAVLAALSDIAISNPYVLVSDDAGQRVYRSPLLNSAEVVAQDIERLIFNAIDQSQERGRARVETEEPAFLTVSPPGRERLRVLCCSPVGVQETGVLHLGSGLGDVSTMLQSLGVVSMVVCLPLVLLLTSYGGWAIATRALKPMHAIQADLQTIQATDLSKRVTVRTSDEELSDLVDSVNQLLQRLERAFLELRHFAADASHQLQTPLTVMKGTLEVALRSSRDPESEGFHRSLENLLEEVENMSGTIEGLRDLSLVDATELSERAALVDLTAVCLEAIEIVEALAERANVTLDTAIDRDVSVRGDSIRLRQVILNLCDNAVKYTSEGGSVRITLSTHHRLARLTVTDSGIGISEANLPRVFDRFYRGDAAGTSSGTGLGLAIAKRIIEVHHGTMTASSKPGEGSTFEVDLPLA